jgi:uncharacterized protein YkwD
MIRRLILAGSGISLAVASLLVVLAGARFQTANALTNCDTGTATLSTAEQSLVDQLNAYRSQNGLAPLKVSPNLSRAAAFMAEDLLEKGYWSHFEPSGRSPFQRASDCGYPSKDVGENLARGISTASGALAGFKSSGDHNEHMLRPRWVVVGIGYAGGYWAMEFGTVDDSGAPGGPTTTPGTPTATKTASSSPTPTLTPTPGPGQPSKSPIKRATLQMVSVE